MSGQPLAVALMVDAPGNDRAERLAALFDTHHDRLYRLARRLTSNRDDALDLVQETFLRAAKSPGSVPPGHASEEKWLVRVLVNIRRDQWRKIAVRNHFAASLSSSAPLDDSNQESALIARTTVWKALDVLHPRRRAVIVMHELEGMTVPAIASLLGISAITVRWHLSRGRRDLTRVLTTFMGDHA
jgi:RNA polymerase sigma factor (sigma-70 family)